MNFNGQSLGLSGGKADAEAALLLKGGLLNRGFGANLDLNLMAKAAMEHDQAAHNLADEANAQEAMAQNLAQRVNDVMMVGRA